MSHSSAKRCGREGCPNLILAHHGRGRAREYCSNGCRYAAARTRAENASPKLAAQPFARAMREAIAGTGLALEEIAKGLENQGYSIVKATLSNWQNGKNLPPDTEDSRMRIQALERFFTMTPGSLSIPLATTRAGQHLAPHDGQTAARAGSATPPPRPRDPERAIAERRAWLDRQIVAAGGGPSRENLVCTRQRLHHVIGYDRWPRETRVALEVYTLRPGIDRYWFPYTYERCESAVILPADPCRIGQILREEDYAATTHDGIWLAAVELIFDRALMPGQPYEFSYVAEYSRPAGGSDNLPKQAFQRAIKTPGARVLQLSIDFDPRTRPRRLTRCEWRPPRYNDAIVETDIELTSGDRWLLDNPPPRAYGWKWQWPSDSQALPGDPDADEGGAAAEGEAE